MEKRGRFLVASFAADCRGDSSKDEGTPPCSKALAERMNFSQQYVSKILKGKEDLSLDTMTRLEEALEISLVYPEVNTSLPSQVAEEMYV